MQLKVGQLTIHGQWCEVKVDDSQIDLRDTNEQPNHFDKNLFFALVIMHKDDVQADEPNQLLNCDQKFIARPHNKRILLDILPIYIFAVTRDHFKQFFLSQLFK